MFFCKYNIYGYVYDYVIRCDYGWWNIYGGDSDYDDFEVTNKTEDWNYRDVYQDYSSPPSIYGGNWRYYTVVSKTPKACPNPNCDLQNYQEYNKNQSLHFFKQGF